MMHPLESLIRELCRLPGIGEKTASRLAYHISKAEKEEALGLARAINSVKEKVRFCKVCCNLTEGDVCKNCSDQGRDHHTICVVEEPQDAKAIEKTGSFKGAYHVLHGRISPLDGMGPDQITIKELLLRINSEIKEVIIATNPTTEGEATSHYLTKLLRPYNIRISRIALGIPFGGDIEYSDRSTLAKSMELRSEIIG